MVILGVESCLPSRKVTNETILEWIQANSEDYCGNLEKTLKTIHALLKKSGINTRRILGDGETPIKLMKRASENVICKSGIQSSSIDLIIFAGIARGFLEPGNSYFIAKALNLLKADCFDVMDSCMSWVRSMQIANSLLNSGQYKYALIVNGEFLVNDKFNVSPKSLSYNWNYRLKNDDQIYYAFPFFTLGEAATATLITADNPSNFKFAFCSKPEFSDLCSVPLESYKGYCELNEKIGKNGLLRFTSFTFDMLPILKEVGLEVFWKLGVDPKDIDTVFTHTHSKRDWSLLAKDAGLGGKIFEFSSQTGNLAAASIPTGLALAEAEGRLKRGDKVMCWTASAGMVFSSFSFTY